MKPGATTSPSASSTRSRGLFHLVDRDDPAIAHPEIPRAGRRAGPVDQRPAGDEEVQHDAERTPEIGSCTSGAEGGSIEHVFGDP